MHICFSGVVDEKIQINTNKESSISLAEVEVMDLSIKAPTNVSLYSNGVFSPQDYTHKSETNNSVDFISIYGNENRNYFWGE